jgi:large subunit ribosomal protein L3
MTFILGEKIEMSQKFNETGQVAPVTVIRVLPSTVTQIKTLDKDGYQAVQIGAGTKKKISKSLKGHLKDLGSFRYLREFIPNQDEKYALGQVLNIDIFMKGEKVKVSGTSKGKGFQGVVRRYNFSGSPKTHGHKDQLRMPGSIGSKSPGPVAKGQKMPGRMGNDRVTIHNLEVIDIDKEKSLLYLKGAVPGVRKGLIIINKINKLVSPSEVGKLNKEDAQS